MMIVRVEVIQNVRTLESVGKHQGFISQQFHGAAIGNEPALIENNGARTELHRQFEIVRGDELGGRQAAQHRLEFAPATGIEITGGFIQHQHGGFAGQHPGETDPALFAMAQMMRGAVFKAGKPNLSQSSLNTRSHLSGA